MNAKAQKSAVLLATQTVKIQTLIKKIPPVFQDEEKEFYSQKALCFHKNQNGLIKISRWKFDDERKMPLVLEKFPIKIENENQFYQYEENADKNFKTLDETFNENPASNFNTKDEISFYVNFSDSEIFYDCDSYLKSQSASMVFEHPILLSCKNFLTSLNDENLKPFASENNQPTPVIFQNVPRWILLAKNKQIIPIQKETKTNIISMQAPGAKGEYTKEQIFLLLKTALVAFSGAAKIARSSKKKFVTVHTGNWGCGNLGNNKELIYLLQIIAASSAGIQKIIFHKADDEPLLNAIKKFLLLFPDLPKTISLKKIVNRIFKLHFFAE